MQAAYIGLAIMALAAALDLRGILMGGISGVPRIARHLWRMCLGLFVATGSFFLGQQEVFPAPCAALPFSGCSPPRPWP